MRATLYFLAIIIFTIACKSDLSEEFYNINFNLVGDFSISLDERSDYNFYYYDVIEISETEYFVAINQLNSNLDFYLLENGEKKFSTPIPIDGPFGLGYVQGFTFVNVDSIFFYRRGSFRGTILTDIEGNVKRSFAPGEKENSVQDIINHVSIPKSPTYFINGKLNFLSYQILDNQNPDNFNSDILHSGNFDLINETIQFEVNSGYPPIFWDKTWSAPSTSVSRILGHNNQWVYSWDLLDSVFVFDFNYKRKRSYMVKSLFKPNNIDLSDYYTNNEYTGTNLYYSIKYDKFRNLYYRILFLKPKVDIKSVPGVPKFDNFPFVILVLDENFNIITEKLFSPMKYKPTQSFVGRDGFYLPLTNGFNPNLKEDLIQYEIYSVK